MNNATKENVMKIMRRLKVPTGDIVIGSGEYGELEFLSIGDYGKEVNLKADFMGLTREPGQVSHTELLPLEEKWVITISTQYGCSMGCNFCDVPKVGPGKNATLDDLKNQIKVGLSLHPEVVRSDRLNVHFARMGEPTWNQNVLSAAFWLKDNIDAQYKCHPVVSTMMPRKNDNLKEFVHEWMHIKNWYYKGNAGLQLSINSTNEVERFIMFGDSAHTLQNIASIMDGVAPVGRKITLNFAVADYEIDPSILLRYFDPEHYIIKLTPMHKTLMAVENDISTDGDYTKYHSYKDHEINLRKAGYDVLVFIASEAEDLGRITCGNAILSGTLPDHKFLLEDHAF